MELQLLTMFCGKGDNIGFTTLCYLFENMFIFPCQAGFAQSRYLYPVCGRDSATLNPAVVAPLLEVVLDLAADKKSFLLPPQSEIN